MRVRNQETQFSCRCKGCNVYYIHVSWWTSFCATVFESNPHVFTSILDGWALDTFGLDHFRYHSKAPQDWHCKSWSTETTVTDLGANKMQHANAGASPLKRMHTFTAQGYKAHTSSCHTYKYCECGVAPPMGNRCATITRGAPNVRSIGLARDIKHQANNDNPHLYKRLSNFAMCVLQQVGMQLPNCS